MVFVNSVFTKAYFNIVWFQNKRERERETERIYTQQLSFICVMFEQIYTFALIGQSMSQWSQIHDSRIILVQQYILLVHQYISIPVKASRCREVH